MIIKNIFEAEEHIEKLRVSADAVKVKIMRLSNSHDGIDFLRKLKFERVGYDPLDINKEFNLIEQINQTFTYLASFLAVKVLFEQHKDLSQLVLNLGTAAGSDIESIEYSGIAAEVFAATNPSSNNKLNNDLIKVNTTDAKYKYVFFMCPNIKVGIYEKNKTKGTLIWSLGTQ